MTDENAIFYIYNTREEPLTNSKQSLAKYQVKRNLLFLAVACPCRLNIQWNSSVCCSLSKCNQQKLCYFRWRCWPFLLVLSIPLTLPQQIFSAISFLSCTFQYKTLKFSQTTCIRIRDCHSATSKQLSTNYRTYPRHPVHEYP